MTDGGSSANGRPRRQSSVISHHALAGIGIERYRVHRAPQRLRHLAEGILGERHHFVVRFESLAGEEGLRLVARGPGYDQVGAGYGKAVGLADDREHALSLPVAALAGPRYAPILCGLSLPDKPPVALVEG